MPTVRQVIHLADVTPPSRQVELLDPTTLKISSYETDYGYIKVRTDFERGVDGELIGVTCTVVP